MRVRLIFRRDRYGRGGDNIAFLENGYGAAVRFTEPREDFRHQHHDVRVEDGVQFGDLLRFVDFPYLAPVTRVNIAALAMLANAPARPANAQIVAKELTNDTTLRWRANREPDPGRVRDRVARDDGAALGAQRARRKSPHALHPAAVEGRLLLRHPLRGHRRAIAAR
jgi:hypothetical protein